MFSCESCVRKLRTTTIIHLSSGRVIDVNNLSGPVTELDKLSGQVIEVDNSSRHVIDLNKLSGQVIVIDKLCR